MAAGSDGARGGTAGWDEGRGEGGGGFRGRKRGVFIKSAVTLEVKQDASTWKIKKNTALLMTIFFVGR